MTSTSSSPHGVCARNAPTAWATFGPRQMTAWLGSTRKPMLMSFRPYFSSGSGVRVWSTVPRPNIIGTLGP